MSDPINNEGNDQVSDQPDPEYAADVRTRASNGSPNVLGSGEGRRGSSLSVSGAHDAAGGLRGFFGDSRAVNGAVQILLAVSMPLLAALAVLGVLTESYPAVVTGLSGLAAGGLGVIVQRWRRTRLPADDSGDDVDGRSA